MELHAHHGLQHSPPYLAYLAKLWLKPNMSNLTAWQEHLLYHGRHSGYQGVLTQWSQPLLTSPAPGTLQAHGNNGGASGHRAQAEGALSVPHLGMPAGGAHRQGRSVPDEELAVHAGRGAEWQHVRHAGCLHRVRMACAGKHILGCKSCSQAGQALEVTECSD